MRRLRAAPVGSSASRVLVCGGRGHPRRGTRAHGNLRSLEDPSIHRRVAYTRSHDFPARAFRSGHLHGSDGFVGLVLVGIEIYEPAGARGHRRASSA
jgi:hypothetical protein